MVLTKCIWVTVDLASVSHYCVISYRTRRTECRFAVIDPIMKALTGCRLKLEESVT